MSESYDIGFVLLKDENSEFGYSIFRKNGQMYMIEDKNQAKSYIEQLLNLNVDIFNDVKTLLKKYPTMRCYKRILLSAPRGVQIVEFIVDWDFHSEEAEFTRQTSETIINTNISNFVGNRGHNVFRSNNRDTVSAIVIIGTNEFPNEGFDISRFKISDIPTNKNGYTVT